MALEKVNRMEGAIHVFEILLEIDRKNSDAQYHKGLALARLGDHRDAITSFEKTIALLPGFAQAYYYKGKSLIEIGKYPEAILTLNRALDRTLLYGGILLSRPCALKDR